jgi:hypothetical protein
MQHYTLNTNHTRTSPRDEVALDVLAAMQPLLQPGKHDLDQLNGAFAGYRLVVPVAPTGFVATLYRGAVPLLTMGVATSDRDEEAIWPALEALYLKITELPLLRSAGFAAPARPASLPWLAVVLIAPHLCPDWAGDFERCLAWAYIDRAKG